MIAFFQIILIFVVPYFIMRHKEFFLTRLIGSIGMAYLTGLTLAFLVYLTKLFGFGIELNEDVGTIGSHAAIAIAIPLLLFSANLKEVKKLAKPVLMSGLALLISVVFVSLTVYFVYAKGIENGNYLSAMAIGLYTGGTPNLNAIGNIFGLDKTLIGVANLSDMLIGGVFYMFLLILAKPMLRSFLGLPKDKRYMRNEAKIKKESLNETKVSEMIKPMSKSFLLAFSMTALGALIGVGIWFAMGAEDGRLIDLLVPTLMISVTVFGVIASFNKKIRERQGSESLGQYLILVFSFALASSMDLERITSSILPILLLYGAITIMAFVVHVLISKWMKIDVDCVIVTATAGLYGPAFVPAVSEQIKNDDMIVPGLILGSVGYAVGTFLGLIIGLVL